LAAAAAGDGSESHKRDALFGLFNRCEPAEAKVIARLVLGEMRLGVGEGPSVTRSQRRFSRGTRKATNVTRATPTTIRFSAPATRRS